MTKDTSSTTKPNVLPVAAVTVGLLLIPLIAMQFTSEVEWDWLDFTVMGVLVFGIGLLIDLALRQAGKYKIPAVIGLILLFLSIWAELAVGIFTDLGS